MEDVLEERGDYRVRLEHDHDCSDPRDDDDFVQIVTPVLRNWNVRTKDALLQKAFDRLAQWDGGMEIFARYAKVFHGITVYAVWMYEHSGVALSARSFVGRAQHAEWDSGQIGFAYLKCPGEPGPDMEERAVSLWVETLGQWMNGENYGYIVEQKVLINKKFFDTEGNELPERNVIYHEWDEVESCWGYIGYDYAEDEALQVLDGFAPNEEVA